MSEAIQLLIIGLVLAGSAIFCLAVIVIAVYKVLDFKEIENDKLVGDLDDEHRI